MNQESDRIPCPKCGANNFPSSAVCWQCGQPLSAQAGNTDQPSQPGPVPPPPSSPVPPSAVPPSQGGKDTQIYIILGFVFAALGLCCCPIFSIAAIILGWVALSKGDKLGTWVIVAGVVSLLIYAVFFAIGFSSGFRGMYPWRPGQNPWMPQPPPPPPSMPAPR